MATKQRTQTPAELKWSQHVNTEHLAPVVIRGLIEHRMALPSDEQSRAHIEQCEECAWVFTSLMSKNGDHVVLDYVYETREALRQMWGAAEDQIADLQEQFAAIRRMQWWMLLGLAALIVLRLWPGLTR